MKLRFISLLLIFFCLSTSAKNTALLVGIGNYAPESGWGKLSSASDIALLQNTFPKSFEINTLIDQQATHKNIIATIKNLIKKCGDGDTVFIHFSSHGQQMLTDAPDETDHLDEALIPYDAPMKKSKSYHGENHLTDNEFGSLIDQLRLKVGENGLVIVTLDACYSDSMNKGDNDDPKEDDIVFRGGADIFGSNEISQDSLDKIVRQRREKDLILIEKIKNGADIILISACLSFQKNYEFTIDDKSYGSLSYSVAKSLSDNGLQNLIQWIDGVMDIMGQKAFRQIPQIRTTLDYDNKTRKTVSNQVSQSTLRSQDNDSFSLETIIISVAILLIIIVLWKVIMKK